MSKSQELLSQFGYEVAAYLGDWNVGEVHDTAIRLNGPDGMEIVLWSGGINFALEDGRAETIKFQVSGEYPPDAFIMPEDKPKINVSYNKGARRVANDIQRRFLGKYIPLYYKKLEVQRGIDEGRSARRRVLTDLAEAFGWKIVEDKDGLIRRVEQKHYGSKLDAILGSSMRPPQEDGRWYVELTLKDLPIDVAFAIADLLKEPRFPPEQLRML